MRPARKPPAPTTCPEVRLTCGRSGKIRASRRSAWRSSRSMVRCALSVRPSWGSNRRQRRCSASSRRLEHQLRGAEEMLERSGMIRKQPPLAASGISQTSMPELHRSATATAPSRQKATSMISSRGPSMTRRDTPGQEHGCRSQNAGSERRHPETAQEREPADGRNRSRRSFRLTDAPSAVSPEWLSSRSPGGSSLAAHWCVGTKRLSSR